MRSRRAHRAFPYRADPVLRGYYWEGYATALREQLVDLAHGSASIVNRGTARSERDSAWFAGYRDGVHEASELANRLYERQMKEAQKTRKKQ
jgi:hypothetical protein